MAAAAGRRRWTGRFVLDIGRALYLGPAFETSLHAHHAIQVCVGLDGGVRLRSGPRTRWVRYDGVVIAADRPHQLAADGRAVALLYLEPESADGRRLGVHGGRGVRRLPDVTVAGLRAVLQRAARAGADGAAGNSVLAAVLARLGVAGVVESRVDARVAHALRALHAGERPPSAELARRVGLSAGRFRHLFLREIGLSYRRYLLWLRLRAALDGLRHEASLTTTAHAAGFADSAHFARTARRMFGIMPSAMPAREREPPASATPGRRGTPAG